MCVRVGGMDGVELDRRVCWRGSVVAFVRRAAFLGRDGGWLAWLKSEMAGARGIVRFSACLGCGGTAEACVPRYGWHGWRFVYLLRRWQYRGGQLQSQRSAGSDSFLRTRHNCSSPTGVPFNTQVVADGIGVGRRRHEPTNFTDLAGVCSSTVS